MKVLEDCTVNGVRGLCTCAVHGVRGLCVRNEQHTTRISEVSSTYVYLVSL